VEDKEKEEITRQVTRRALPTMSSRLVTKVWISQEEAKEEESAEVTRRVTRRVAPYYVQSPSGGEIRGRKRESGSHLVSR
jgi:hypothetical protein